VTCFRHVLPEKLADRQACHRVAQIAGDFGKRFEHEAPFAKSRMRAEADRVVKSFASGNGR